MGTRRPLIFGPAYIDIVVDVDGPLLPSRLLDQSLPALRSVPRADGLLEIRGPAGDCLRLVLPPEAGDCAATYELAEPVLARLEGLAAPPVIAAYPVRKVTRELGGMGAGYAKALGGVLRMPLGMHQRQPDAVGRDALACLARYGIEAVPALVPECDSDTSLLLQTARGDKLAIGVRRAMACWTVTADDHALAARADALVCCGVPNAQALAVLAVAPPVPVMCAPALRNVADRTTPLVRLAPYVHYLTMNALEWAHVPEREAIRQVVPLVTITDGARGSTMLLGPVDVPIPAVPVDGPTETNRAGETYGATVFRALRAWCPDFPRGMTPALVERAGRLAAQQAARQLALRGFGFPPAEEY